MKISDYIALFFMNMCIIMIVLTPFSVNLIALFLIISLLSGFISLIGYITLQLPPHKKFLILHIMGVVVG